MLPSKNYNLIMPFETYQSLKKLSMRLEKPIAAIVRQAIDFVLQNANSWKPETGE